MLSPDIAYRGQPVAMVVADTLEQATEGARLVRPAYAPAPFKVMMANAPASDIVNQAESPLPKPAFADRAVGDADAAYAAAPVKVDGWFTSPAQHQNPMELISTWRSGAATRLSWTRARRTRKPYAMAWRASSA